MVSYPRLTDNSPWHAEPSLEAGRSWIFPANRDLTEEMPRISALLHPFLRQWTAHGSAVEARAALISGHFLVIAEGMAGEASSGCSQDALRGVIGRLQSELNTPLMAGGRIFWLDSEDKVQVLDRAGFRAASAQGQVSQDTWVFDTLVERVKDLRVGGFIKRARDSWHARLLAPTESQVRP